MRCWRSWWKSYLRCGGSSVVVRWHRERTRRKCISLHLIQLNSKDSNPECSSWLLWETGAQHSLGEPEAGYLRSEDKAILQGGFGSIFFVFAELSEEKERKTLLETLTPAISEAKMQRWQKRRCYSLAEVSGWTGAANRRRPLQHADGGQSWTRSKKVGCVGSVTLIRQAFQALQWCRPCRCLRRLENWHFYMNSIIRHWFAAPGLLAAWEGRLVSICRESLESTSGFDRNNKFPPFDDGWPELKIWIQ